MSEKSSSEIEFSAIKPESDGLEPEKLYLGIKNNGLQRINIDRDDKKENLLTANSASWNDDCFFANRKGKLFDTRA